MPERTFSSPEYRYGFNGKEKDESGEWGSLTHYDYGARIYNPGIARFLSLDPLMKSQPQVGPYSFADNQPIWAFDKDGQIKIIIHKHNRQADGSYLTVTSEKEYILPDELLGIQRSPIIIDQYYEEEDMNPAPSLYEGKYVLKRTEIRENGGETKSERIKRTNPVGYWAMRFAQSPLNLTQSDNFSSFLLDRDIDGRIRSKNERDTELVTGLVSVGLLFVPVKGASNLVNETLLAKEMAKDIAKRLGTAMAIEGFKDLAIAFSKSHPDKVAKFIHHLREEGIISKDLTPDDLVGYDLKLIEELLYNFEEWNEVPKGALDKDHAVERALNEN